MAVSLTHTTVAVGTNAGNGEIAKEQWNENHTLTMAADRILGRTTAGAGAVEEIAAGTGLTLSAGTLSVAANTYQPLDSELTALSGLASAADTAPYFTGAGTAALMTVTAAGRNLLDDADAAAQRTTLGLAIGTDVQAYDAELAAIAGLVSAADRLPYFTGAGTASLATFTAAGRNLLDDANTAAQRATLGLTIGTDVQAYDADLSAIAALAGTSGFLKKTAADTWSLDTSTYLTSAVTTISFGTTGLTPSTATSGAVTVAGTLAVANGGTGAGTAADAATNLGLGTGDSPQFTAVNVGHASDTTITRSAAGVLAVEGGVIPKENRSNTFTQSQTIARSDADPFINVRGDGRNALALLTSYGAVTSSIRVQRATGSEASPTAPASGSNLGDFRFQGYDGTTFVNAAQVSGVVDGVSGAGDMPGRLVFSTTPDGSTTLAERMRIDSNGNVLVTGVGGLGYGTGSGGAVTQGTNRTTGVTLNKTNGAITLVSAAGSTTWQTFTVTNSTVVATDTVIVSQKSGTDLNEIHVTNVAAGSFNISFRTTGGTTTEQPVFNFAVIKAVTS